MTSSPIPNPQVDPDRRALPDYLPARMINEFVYCPRLFYYEQVEGLFAHSSDTVEGEAQHKRVDKEGKALPPAEELEEEELRTRSIMLASDGHRVIAKMDLVEVADGEVTPVDYKHGRPRETDQGIELWPTDRVQLAVQGLILRDNGYRCQEGLVFYPEDAAACASQVHRRVDRRDVGDDRSGLGDGGGRADSATAGGFAEVYALLAGGDLPARRDPSVAESAGDCHSTAFAVRRRTQRPAKKDAGTRDAAAGDAKNRSPPTV